MIIPFFKPDIFLIASPKEILEKASGDNARGVLVIARFLEGAEIAEQDLLYKILKSVQLESTKDILLLKAATDDRFPLSALCRQTGSRFALLFGIDPPSAGLHFRIQKYQPFSVNGITGLWADQLSAIEGSKELKNALWIGLKAISFNPL